MSPEKVERSADDLDSHREGGPCDRIDRRFKRTRGHVAHLHLGDVFDLLTRDLPDFLLAGLVRSRSFFLFGVQTGGLLAQAVERSGLRGAVKVQ